MTQTVEKLPGKISVSKATEPLFCKVVTWHVIAYFAAFYLVPHSSTRLPEPELLYF